MNSPSPKIPIQRPVHATEPAHEACAAIIHFIAGQRLSLEQRALLIADYSMRAQHLGESSRAAYDKSVIDSFRADIVQTSGIDVRAKGAMRTKIDVAVLTVLQPELEAALYAFEMPDKPTKIRNVRRYYEGKVPSQYAPSGELSIVVAASGESRNAQAQLAMTDILQYYEPETAFLLGIAAGNSAKLGVGEVIVPEAVHHYEPGRYTVDGEEPRPDRKEVPELIRHNFFYYNPAKNRFYERTRAFIEQLPKSDRPRGLKPTARPKVTTRNVIIASGEKVLADGTFLPSLRQRFDERIVLADQEGYGFAMACRGLLWSIVRGISDNGDSAKNDSWQFVAAAFAALCLRDFLETQFVPPSVGEL
jgi:nucleoside phosphorylase